MSFAQVLAEMRWRRCRGRERGRQTPRILTGSHERGLDFSGRGMRGEAAWGCRDADSEQSWQEESWVPGTITASNLTFGHCDGSHEKECEPLFECCCDESPDHQGLLWTLELYSWCNRAETPLVCAMLGMLPSGRREHRRGFQTWASASHSEEANKSLFFEAVHNPCRGLFPPHLESFWTEKLESL